MIEFWIIFALLAALTQALNPLINEYFKVNAIYLLFWVRLIVALTLAPVAFQFAPPSDPMFYVGVFGAVSCFTYFDFVYFTQAAKSGAGVITRFEGLVVGMTFVMWLLIDPALVADYIQNPVRGVGIVGSMAVGVYFALKMRHCHLTLDTLKAMLPALVLGALGIVFGKLAMVHSGHHQGVWYYAFLQSFLAVLIYGVVLKAPVLSRRFGVPKVGGLFDKRVFMAAGLLSVGWLMHTISKYYAITEVENPAYVTIIGLTSPLIVLLIYKGIGRREEADIKSGLWLVFSAIALVCFAYL